MLRIAAAQRRQLEEAVTAGYPLETCGLLLGRTSEAACTVLAVRQARNLRRAQAAVRYELDPDDQLAAEREARAKGWEVIGVWHAHPDHPARPSEADRAQAWAGYAYLILSVSKTGVQDFRTWRLVGDAFVEEPVAAIDAAAAP